MPGADPWVEQYAAPSTASPSEMHSSLAISGSEGYKTASAGNEGSGGKGNLQAVNARTPSSPYPSYGTKTVIAAPALMGSGAVTTSAGRNVADFTLDDDLQFAADFVLSSGGETSPYGPKVQKRESSASRRERRIGPIAVPQARARKTSLSKRNLDASPRGRAPRIPGSADESMARPIFEMEGRPHSLGSNPVPIRPTLHRSIANLPAVGLQGSDRSASTGDRPPSYTPMSTSPLLAGTGQRSGVEATNGSHGTPAQASSSGQGAIHASPASANTSRSKYKAPPPGEPYRPPHGGQPPRPSWSSGPCLLYPSPRPRHRTRARMPPSA